MHWPREDINPFPSPHRDEPTGLRADILDELADHLALSAEEEKANNGQTEEDAWMRALDRFGDPDAVARRLWWDAMKGKVMRDWIQTGIAGLSAVVVLFVGIYVIMNMQSMQATQAQLAETLQKINSQSQTPAGESLDIEVRRGKPDGLPAAGVHVRLTGKLNGESNASVVLDTDAKGHARFFPVPQGAYTIGLEDPQSLMSLRADHSLFAGVGSTRQFLAPDFVPVPTRVVLKPPLPFPNERLLMEVRPFAQYSAWTYKGQFFVGNAGIYAPDAIGNSVHVDETMLAPTILLPPTELQLMIRAVLNNPEKVPQGSRDSRFGESVTGFAHLQTASLSANQENVITVELTEDELQRAKKFMMNYAARRWLPDCDLNGDSPIDAFVVSAQPIADTAWVGFEKNGETKARLTWPEAEQGQADAFPRRGPYWRILGLTGLDMLAKSYPSEYRFLVAGFDLEKAEAFPWKGTECTHEPGSSSLVELGLPLSLERSDTLRVEGRTGFERCAYADITPLVRGEVATAPCGGVLLHLLEPIERRITMGQENQKWRAPHLLVVSDTPPEDL
jgi:hypothetical protein